MTSPTLSAAKDEVEAASAAASHILPGLNDFARVSLSAAVMPQVQQAITAYARRRDLCDTVLRAIDALEADGFPDEIGVELSEIEDDEFQGQMADFEAAAEVFTRRLPATSADIDLGAPVDRSPEE